MELRVAVSVFSWHLTTARTQKNIDGNENSGHIVHTVVVKWVLLLFPQAGRGCGMLFGPVGCTSLRRSTWSKTENTD